MNKKRILLIDDVPLFLQLQISFLGRRNYDIHTACNGEEGLLKAFSLRPDLILLDFVMSGLNGAEVCRRVKMDPRTQHIPVVIISSSSGEETVKACGEAGCNGLLFKPVKRETLICTVEDQLKIKRRRCERVETSLPAVIRNRTDWAEARIMCLAVLGCRIEVERPVIPGEIYEISFAMPNNDKTTYLKGSIVWTDLDRGNSKVTAGMEFIYEDTKSKFLLQDCIHSMLLTAPL